MVINVYRERCDALILLSGSDETVLIPLSPEGRWFMQATESLAAVGARTRADDEGVNRGRIKTWKREHGRSLSPILHELWNDPAKSIPNALVFNKYVVRRSWSS